MDNHTNTSGDVLTTKVNSSAIMQYFIKILSKINTFDITARGIFILINQYGNDIFLYGSPQIKTQLSTSEILAASYWSKINVTTEKPILIKVNNKLSLNMICVPISNSVIGKLGYLAYVTKSGEPLDHIPVLLRLLCYQLIEYKLERQENISDLVNQYLVSSRKVCCLVVDSKTNIVHVSTTFLEQFNSVENTLINHPLLMFFLFPPAIKAKIQQREYIKSENIDFDFNGQLKFLNLSMESLTEEYYILLFVEPKKNQDSIAHLSEHRLKPTLTTYVTYSPKVQRVINSAKEAMKSTNPIYILGEEGTGKRSLALAIHNSCHKFKDGPFIAINLHSVSKIDMSDLLLGEQSNEVSKSKFEMANGGTLYIERIDLLPGILQAALTHIILTKTLFDINTNKTVDLNFRLITSSIRPLDILVHERRFCPSLYFYLTGATLNLPSLHERKEDLPYLINKKLKSMNINNDLIIEMSRMFQEYATSRDWKGNISELFKWIEHCYLNKGDFLVNGKSWDLSTMHANIESLANIEKREIANALNVLNRNYNSVAKQLGISLSTLRRKISKYYL